MQQFNLKINESVVIMTDAGPVSVMLTCIKRGGHGYEKKCRLGIEAHKSIPVHREEVFNIIKRDQEKASLRAPIDVNRAKS